jgi:hypothetical protein
VELMDIRAQSSNRWLLRSRIVKSVKRYRAPSLLRQELSHQALPNRRWRQTSLAVAEAPPEHGARAEHRRVAPKVKGSSPMAIQGLGQCGAVSSEPR